MRELSSKEVRKVLWEIALATKARKTPPNVANASVGALRSILRSVAQDIQVMKLAGVKPSQKMLREIE